MKRILLLFVVLFALGVTSCKKDRLCDCTNTYTSTSGNVTTDTEADVTYREMSKRRAKDLCQKQTRVYVNSGGGTSTEVYDCKLK